jgi:Transcriptional regulator
MAGGAAAPGQSVVGKVALILSTFQQGGRATLTEIVRSTSLPMSTVHRLVGELTARRLLTRDDDAVYRPGLSLRALTVADHDPDVAVHGRAVLSDLARATRGSARLCVLDGPRVAVLGEGDPQGRTTPAWPTRLPAHATAAGKALLAFSPTSLTRQVLGRGLTRCTAATITSPEMFRHCLAQVRLGQIAISCGEHLPAHHTVAVPVFGRGGTVAAALELTVRDLPGDLPVARPALVVAAGALSRELLLAGQGQGTGATLAALAAAR